MIIAIHARTAQAQRQLAAVQAQLKSLQSSGVASAAAAGTAVNGLNAKSENARKNSNKPWFSQMRASGSQIQWVGRQMSVGLTLPLIGAMALGTKFALDFEKNMTRVSKVYGDTALELSLGSTGMKKEVDALGRAFVELGNKYGESASDVAAIGAEWAAAGSSGRALAKQTELTMQTMVLGEMSATEATEALISIQAQWGVVTESNQDKVEAMGGAVRNRAANEMSLTNILRQLNAVENETGAKMQDLVKGYQRASGTARSAGVTTGELAAMIAALVPAAGGAAEAGTALRTMLNRVMTPMNDAREVLAKMNIDVTKADWVTKSATERLDVMAKSFHKLTGPQQQWLGFVIAGRWHVNRFMILMNAMANSNSYYGKTLKTLSDQARVTRIAEQELNAVLTSNPQRMKQAGAIIQNSLMKAMIPLVPVITQVALWFGKLANAFMNIPPHIRTTILAAALFLGVLGPMIIFLGMIKLAIGMLAPAFIAMAKFILLPLKPFAMLATVAGRALTFIPLAAVTASKGVVTAFAFMLKGMGMVGAAWGVVSTAIVAWAPKILMAWRGVAAGMAMLPAAMAAMAVGFGKVALVIDAMMALMRFRVAAGIGAITTLFAAGPAAWRIAMATGMGVVTLAMDAALALMRLRIVAWFAVTRTIFFMGPIAWGTVMAMGLAKVRAVLTTGLIAKLTLTKAWAAASLLIHKIHWAGVVAVAKAGTIALVTNMRKLGPLLLRALVSPWGLAIAAVIGIVVLFKDQIVSAFNNVVDYFRNLPSGIKAGLAPIGRIFVAIKNGILKAFNALPEGIRNAMLAVINVVKSAAMAVYKLFSYLNPFAHHSPSLVENVTNGMAVVNEQFANSARLAAANVNKIHSAIKSLEGAGSGVVGANAQANDAEFRDKAARAGGAGALPQYDALNRQINESKRALDSMSLAVEAQEAKVKSVDAAVKRYDKTIKEMNKSLEVTKAVQASVGDALDSAKARYDRFSNAQIKGYSAAEDAIFANEMAQKRLQLQIKRMEAASGSVDSVTDSYSKLQGQIELLQGKQAELRAGGAGSDILGPYDDMIGKLKSEQGALSGAGAGPAGAIAALTTQLDALQRQAEMMDLEKALKFDSLNRNIEKFKNTAEEMSYSDIMNGLDSSRNSVNALSLAYDSLGYQLKGQEYQIGQVEQARAMMQDRYDIENEKLSKLKESYDTVEEGIRAGEQAMQDFASAIDETIQRQEALANAAKKNSKKKKKGKGPGEEGEDPYTAAEGFEDAGQADFAIPGSSNAIMREGGMGDQSGEIDDFTSGLQKSIEESLGGMNPFAPIKGAWDKVKDWFKKDVGPVGSTFGAMFQGIGKSIQAGFNGGEPAVDAVTRAFAENRISIDEYRKRLAELGQDNSYTAIMERLQKGVQEKDNVFVKVGDWAKGAWDKIREFGSLAWNVLSRIFGPELRDTAAKVMEGLGSLWDKLSGPLNDLKNAIMPLVQAALPYLAIALGGVLGALKILWSMINGAIVPVFNFLGDLIGGIIKIITGAIKVITGVMNVVWGVVKTIAGLIMGVIGLFQGKGLAGFATFGDGIKTILGGLGDILGGVWDIIKGLVGSIISLFVNLGKTVLGVVWGFIRGIFNFFYGLWDELVGHSIIPDMINAIIKWFKELPGKIPGMIWSLITTLIGAFLKLPAMIGKALLALGGFLFNAFVSAMGWLLPKLPGMIWNIIKFFATLPFKILTALGSIGLKLLGWLWDAITWLVPQLPGIVWNIITFFASLPGKFLGALGDIGAKLWEWMKAGWQWLVDNLPGIVQSVIDYFKNFPGNFIRGLGVIGEKLGEWMRAGWNWLVENLPKIIEPVLNYFKNLPGNFIRGLGVIGDKLWEWMQAGWNWLVDNMPGIIKGFLGFIGGIPGKLLGKLGDGAKVLFSYGKDMIQGLMNGTAGLLKKLGDWFLDKIPGWIKTPFKKALGIASPSKVFAGYGQNIGQGLINGIDGMQPQIEAASVAMAAAADKGEVGGMAISAVADTSSVGGSVSALGSAVAATGPVGVDAAIAPTTDTAALQADLDAAKAIFDAFAIEMETKTATFAASISTTFSAMSSSAASAFTNISSVGVASFTALQTSVVTIVTTMVTTVNGQLQLLISYVTAFGTSFTAAWNAAWQAWMTQTTTATDHTVSEWTRMATGMQSTLDNSIRPVFDEMKEMLTELENAYSTTVDNIGTTWSEVETKTKKPAGVVINEVYNNGLRGAWNKFNSFLGVKELPAFTVAYATGGPVWGPGTETSDSIYARLSRNEHVITAKEVRGAGGHQAIMAQRAIWAGKKRLQGVDPSLPAFARGGPVDPKAPPWPGESNLKPAAILARRNIHKYWPMIGEIGGYRPVDRYPDHPSGLALDVMVGQGNPVGDEVNEWLHKNMVPLALNYTIWKQFYKPAGGGGNLMPDRGDPTQNHMDHVHALFNNNGVPGINTGGIGGSSGGAPIDYKKIVEESFKADMDAIRAKLPKIAGDIGQWPKVSADVAQKMALKHLLPIAEKMSISSGSAASAWAGAPDASVVEKVKAAMATYGWDKGAEWEALNQLIGHESSWNPNAQNPSSTAYGLFQFLDSTWAGVGGSKTSDPYQQAIYGGRYIKQRYGSPSAAWAFWQNPQPNPYGGNWYDAGGMLMPGTQVVHNQTGGPEPVLTQSQWSAMYTAASSANVLEPDDVQHAVEQANKNTGNTADKQAAAIIKGMDVWQRAWTPTVYEAADKVGDAADKVATATEAQSTGTVLLSKSIGKYNDEIAALSKLLNAVSTAAMASTKVTITYDQEGNQTGVNNPGQKTDKNGKPIFTVDQPTFSTWAPVLDALAGFLETIPYAERDWAADNPVPGESQTQRKMREAQNALVNFSKGSFNIIKDVGPTLLRHTGIIGSAVEKLIQEDGTAWTTAIGMIATGNVAGFAILIPLILKAVGTLLPLILSAILDIVPALIRAIVRFLTQFMPDSVYAYADMAAAEEAVRNQQDGGPVAMGQGQRYPVAQSNNVQGNAPVNIYVYGVELPNITDGDDASDFVNQLKLLAANS